MKPFRFFAYAGQLQLQRCFSVVFLVLILVVGVISPAQATGVWELPTPTDADPLLVLDEGDVLSRATEGSLGQASQDLAEQTGLNLHWVTVHRLDYGDTAKTLAQQLLKEWYPKADQRAKQAILVLDTVTNTAGLELGATLQPLLPEALAQSIIAETLAQPLRQNRYNQAVQDASNRLVAVLSGRTDPGPPKIVASTINAESTFALAEETAENRVSSTVWVVALLVAATVIPMATYYFYLFLQSKA